MPLVPLVCPQCRSALKLHDDAAIRCTACDRRYRIDDGICDFAEGRYYDAFAPGDEVAGEHARGLALEVHGAETRARYYLDAIRRRFGDRGVRALDCGCGNGLVVERLREAGIDAWGNDNSALRKWQWRERPSRERLVVADGARLPFPDGWFDVVICSGVLEHIGVDERGGETYVVAPRPTRDEERARFLAELLRVTARDGVVFLDFPNGAFPIDFWHGVTPGGARRHSTREGFLPTVRETRALLRQIEPDAPLRAVSPRGRLAFRQVSSRRVGRALAPLGRLLFLLFDAPGGALLAGTRINPYLVLEVQRSRAPGR